MNLTLTNFFGLLGGLLVLAFIANRLSRRTRVPDVIVLLCCGILLGPVLHWIDADRFPQIIRGVGTLALILILFAAGLELDLRRALKQFLAGTVLAILSYGLTLAGVAYFCIRVLHFNKMPSLLMAAALACVSSSLVLPVLDHLDLRRNMRTTLVIEASFGDGLGAIGVAVLIGLAQGGSAATQHGGAILGGVFALFLFKFLLAFVIAVVAGFLWARLLPYISDKQFWQSLTFAAVLMVYSGTHAVGGSELFAVMVFGATLTSLLDPQNSFQEFGLEILSSGQGGQIHFFHSELAFLVRSFFFVLLGAMIEFRGLKEKILPSLGIVAVFLVARFVAVTLSRIVWRGTSSPERELACLLIPRGLITAVLTFEVVQAMPNELESFPSLTLAVILLTNALLLAASIRARALTTEPAEQLAAEPQL